MKKYFINYDTAVNTKRKKLHRVKYMAIVGGYKKWGKINLALSEPQDINDLDYYVKELVKLGS